MLSEQTKPKSLPYISGWVLIVGILFLASNLRAPLTSVGPLIGTIRDSLVISNTVAGLLTTLPLLAFAVVSPMSPKLARRFGMSKTLFLSLIILTVGVILRSSGNTFLLYAGTALMGVAIAAGNVLLPALVKQKFPHKVGLMTSLYTISMGLGGAIAAGVSIPLADQAGLGWRGALSIWAILSIVSLFAWIPQLKTDRQLKTNAAVLAAPRVNLWTSPLAWQVTMVMGLQSIIFYVLLTWFPEMMREIGLSPAYAGWLLSLMQLVVLPASFVIPILAARMKNQRVLVMITFVLYLLGLGGLLIFKTGPIVLWAICIGLAFGFAFSLAIIFFTLRTKTPHEAAELSGMAQSVGYLLAAVGPALVGFLNDVSGSWTIPLLTLIGASVLFLIFGLGAAKNRHVLE